MQTQNNKFLTNIYASIDGSEPCQYCNGTGCVEVGAIVLGGEIHPVDQKCSCQQADIEKTPKTKNDL